MPHLVQSIEDVTLDECYRQLKAAHDYLAACGAQTLAQASQVHDGMSWGSTVKRLRVTLTAHHRPPLVAGGLSAHNLIEVINQCATMERLLDAIVWAQEEFPLYRVERCHPTTSSSKADAYDHDLVLLAEDEQRAIFEVSDVVNATDSNRKATKDLESLGVIGPRCEAGHDPWHNARLFLVVSAELAQRLNRRSLRAVWHYDYVKVRDSGPTRIIEVVKRVRT